MEIVLLSQDNCGPCKMLKKYMDREGIEFREINISKEPEQADKYGIMSTPVTILEDEGEEVTRFNGFSPDKVEEFAEYL